MTAGEGHNACAKAALAALERADVDCRMEDMLLLHSRIVQRVFNGAYLFMLRRAPFLMKWMDSFLIGEKHPGRRKGINGFIGKLFNKPVRRLIGEYQPDAIICTHVYGVLMLTNIRRKHGLEAPLIGINTDFALQSLWDDTEADYIVLAAEGLTHACVKRGMKEERLWVTGLPIQARFQEKVEKRTAREQLGIRDMPTILIMSGSMGYGDLPKVIKRLDSLPMEVQMLVVCGKNEKLKGQLEELSTRNPLVVYGFVDNIPLLMDGADLMLTKPGGLSTSECLAKGLPLVMMDPIPGLEERNALFLLAQGAGILSTKQFPPDEAVYQLLKDPERTEQILARQAVLGKPAAADELVHRIKEVVEGMAGEG
ncbi:glycosyltransferase [Eubacteriales bacterium OttesenSCG-928-M02]|nr:glycosyltransferase [Eubacteriales bacterium OttesenSCG-928-M02]